MAAQEPVDPPFALSPGAELLVEAAAAKQAEGPVLGIRHWLLALLERHAPMVASMVQGLDVAGALAELRERVAQNEPGEALDRERAVRLASEQARARGMQRVYETDLARVILAGSGYAVGGAAAPAPSAAAAATATAPGTATRPSAQPQPAVRKLRPTPTLDEFGRDLTKLARAGRLMPVVGRDSEIEMVIETLCRRIARNPALVGAAGVGKTAIIEGLALLIVQDRVPPPLKGLRIVELQPSTLVAGSRMVGDLEARMKAVVAEASQEGIALFIDEMHSLMGAGGIPGLSDVASQLKPALARGELACIAATTDDEYRRFIENDRALERRFQPIRIAEPPHELTLAILAQLAAESQASRHVAVPEVVRRWIVDFAERFLRNRCFPAKAVDLLEQCVAHAIVQGRAEVHLADAEAVGQRLIGMPTGIGPRIQVLARRLLEQGELPADDAKALAERLDVTMRGLDIRAERPNAVVLLLGPAAALGPALSETIADALFGSPDRVVAIDFGRLVHPADVTILVGAPPGYVGYSESLPLHRVADMPWCVLRCDDVHAAHPQVLEVLAQALESGSLTDSRGKRIFLSDTVVVLTAPVTEAKQAHLGFKAGAEAPAAADAGVRRSAEGALGARLAGQCDFVFHATDGGAVRPSGALQHGVLDVLSERYGKQGVEVSWDASLIEWLRSFRGQFPNAMDWERKVDQLVGGPLVQFMASAAGAPARRLVVTYHDGAVHIESLVTEPGGS
ncbi:MAG: ATP-dependent Clp protease ATP-binding subunit [Candidatus Eisenbacteria bacterium]|nr:ATP-dependent Clp protease ATP-binding subunit [Candidatus Eisenbacteria bacterium]